MEKHIILLLTLSLTCFNLISQDNTRAKVIMPAHLCQDLDENINIVYSPSFRAAWTLLINEILNSPVKLHNSIPLAEELNHHTYVTGADKTNWITGAGFIEEGIIQEINREMMKRYNTEAPWLDDLKNEREGILCYSYLKFEALFREAFEEFKWTFNTAKGAKDAEYFGVSKGENEKKKLIRKQVSIFDYKHPDDFIIKITPSDPDFEILISEMLPEENIFETVREMDRRMSESFSDPLSSKDELMIPKISLDENYIYKELLDKYLLNKGFEEYFIAAATHGIKLILDQAGARTEVSGKVLLKKGPVPRIYAIDQPFIIIIRKTGSDEPLIFARINDTSFLTLIRKN